MINEQFPDIKCKIGVMVNVPCRSISNLCLMQLKAIEHKHLYLLYNFAVVGGYDQTSMYGAQTSVATPGKNLLMLYADII